MTKVRVVQKEGDEVPTDILATEIQKIADAVGKFNQSRLKRHTIVLLISKSSGVGMKIVADVLSAAESLADEYLRPADNTKEVNANASNNG